MLIKKYKVAMLGSCIHGSIALQHFRFIRDKKTTIGSIIFKKNPHI